jgi:hypothetical protein
VPFFNSFFTKENTTMDGCFFSFILATVDEHGKDKQMQDNPETNNNTKQIKSMK